MRHGIVFALPALLLVTPLSAPAQLALPGCDRAPALTAPIVFVAVNGQCTDLSALVTPVVGGKGWNLLTRVTLFGSTMDLQAAFDPDPGVTFTETTLNPTGEATTYAFLFGLPIVPDFYSSAVSSLHVSVTSARGTTTVDNSATYPAYLSGYGTLAGAFTNLGVDLGTTPCVASGVLGTATCDPGTATNGFAPAYYDNLEALVTYTQDNAGSTATFTGGVTLDRAGDMTVTPEPATLALVAIGFAVLGAFSARQRRRV
jgi:type II secretory pathway pseudopilin PulG